MIPFGEALRLHKALKKFRAVKMVVDLSKESDVSAKRKRNFTADTEDSEVNSKADAKDVDLDGNIVHHSNKQEGEPLVTRCGILKRIIRHL